MAYLHGGDFAFAAEETSKIKLNILLPEGTNCGPLNFHPIERIKLLVHLQGERSGSEKVLAYCPAHV
jgi:hypothetical protein